MRHLLRIEPSENWSSQSVCQLDATATFTVFLSFAILWVGVRRKRGLRFFFVLASPVHALSRCLTQPHRLAATATHRHKHAPHSLHSCVLSRPPLSLTLTHSLTPSRPHSPPHALTHAFTPSLTPSRPLTPSHAHHSHAHSQP